MLPSVTLEIEGQETILLDRRWRVSLDPSSRLITGTLALRSSFAHFLDQAFQAFARGALSQNRELMRSEQ